MKRALLIYNPQAGVRRKHRLHNVQAAAQELQRAGVVAEIAPTNGPGEAGKQARAAGEGAFDTIIACGGDGTVHDVLQGIIGSPAALGVLPLGTANAFANDLSIPHDPQRAMRRLLEYTPQTLAAGVIESCSEPKLDTKERRYFTVMSGVGPDALLVYSLTSEAKERWGVAAYVVKALWEYLKYRHAPYETIITGVDGTTRKIITAQVMAVRIHNFGGPLKTFACGADLRRDDLRAVIFRGGVRVSYPAYLLSALFGLHANIPGVELVNAREIVCKPIPGREDRRIYSEADGECLWTLPVRISILPKAFHLLMPK